MRMFALRALTIGAAFAIAWIVYMVAMVLTVYDGLLSLIFQPIMAVFCSAFVVGVAVAFGQLLRLPLLSRWWNATGAWALVLILGSLFLLCFGYHIGLVETYTDPETGCSFQALHSGVALGSYFALIFAIANWPLRKYGISLSASDEL